MENRPKVENSSIDLDEPKSSGSTTTTVFTSSFTLPIEHKEIPSFSAHTTSVNTIHGPIPSVISLTSLISEEATGAVLTNSGGNPFIGSINPIVSSGSSVVGNVQEEQNIHNAEISLMKQLSLLAEAEHVG